MKISETSKATATFTGNIKDLIRQHKHINKLQIALKEQSKLFCADKSIPLQERWNYFCEYAPLREHKTWIYHFDSLKDHYELFFDDRLSRYETVTVQRMLDIIEGQLELLRDPNYKSYTYLHGTESEEYKKQILDARDRRDNQIRSFNPESFQEEVLSKYIWSYNNDW